MHIRKIKAQETYPIRHEILRRGLPIESARFNGDTDESTFHLGAVLEGRLVSVASFFFRPNEFFSEDVQCQLRGMATLAEHQGKGLGRALLNAALSILPQNGCELVWCNARESAIGFYENMGF